MSAIKGIDTIKVRRADGAEVEYAAKLLAADVGFDTAAKVAALLAGPLGSVLSAGMGLKPPAPPAEGDAESPAPSSGWLSAEVKPEVIASAMSTLGLSLRDPALAEVLATMMEVVERWDPAAGGKKDRHAVAWTVEFAGEYGALLEVLVFALRHNFRSFFSTGPAAALSSAGQSLGTSILQRASTGGSRRSPVAMARPSSPT